MATGTWENNGWKLVWENTAPTSVFPDQKIQIDLSRYREVNIVCRFSTSSAFTCSGIGMIPTADGQGFLITGLAMGLFIARLINWIDTTGIDIAPGRIYSTYGSNTYDNSYVIPVRIYAR